MKNIKLDTYEKEIEDSLSEIKSVSPARRKKVETIIRKANEKRNISLRVNSQDLDLLKKHAEKEGIPYQTLISSVLHKFVTDQFVDQKSIFKSLQLLKSGG
jgi:predicted DNA binding CopG/RHH family protein